MRLLLDTHAVLWWLEDHPRLSRTARLAVSQADNRVWVSPISIWEIETKFRLGKLELHSGSSPVWDPLLERNGWVELPLLHRHASLAGAFSMAHRDPADRFLAAQAVLEDLVLVTCDPAFTEFPVKTLW